MAVVNRIAAYQEEMKGWRRHLHQYPELGLECYDTAAFVVERLKEFGVDEIHTGIAETGVVALIHGQEKGGVTGLRADMDALPMEEETGAEYASKIAGKMHSCGHDGHTTMLLGAAKYLAETRNFSGTVALTFQLQKNKTCTTPEPAINHIRWRLPDSGIWADPPTTGVAGVVVWMRLT